MSLPRRVLFLCANNGVRSHIAAELVRYYGAADFEVESAGVRPQLLHPDVLAVLAEHGIEIRRLDSKAVPEVFVHSFDDVISLCDRNHEPCPTCDDAIATVCWNFPDPTAIHQDEAAVRRGLQNLYTELSQRILLFIIAQRRALGDNSTSLPHIGHQADGFNGAERN